MSDVNAILHQIMTDEDDSKLKLHLGCGHDKWENWVNIDNMLQVEPDLVFDLESCAEKKLPYEDDSVDYIYCAHTLEHIRNILPLMEELHRVAKPNATMICVVPYGANDAAFEDPTHVRQFFNKSFLYFGQSVYGRADYGYRGDWINTDLVMYTTEEAGRQFESAEQFFQSAANLRNTVEDFLAVLQCQKPVRSNLFQMDVPMFHIAVKD